MAKPYYRDSRIRAKLVRFRLTILPGHLENRLLARLKTLVAWCPTPSHSRALPDVVERMGNNSENEGDV